MTLEVDGGAAGDPAADEAWRRLHPRMVLRWRLELLAAGAVVAVLLGVGELIARRAEALDPVPRAIIPAAAFLVAAVVAVVWPPLYHRRWSYRLGADALEIRRGVVVRRTSIVPYRRVQQIDLSRGPLDRLLGLTTAGITTAAATTDGGVPGLVPEVADRFRQVVLERAGRDDAV